MIPANKLASMLQFDDPRHLEASRFLVLEAHLQDSRAFDAWLELLAPDLVYRVPVTSTFGAKPHKEGEMYHMDEDFYSLKVRIDRLKTNMAWTENPASRTQRLITNIACFETEHADEIEVLSGFILFRTQGDYQGPDFLAGKREELIRRTENGLRLTRRTVTLQESVLNTQNLAIFL